MKINRRVKLFGWDNCIVVEHGETMLVVTTDVGPRVVWIGHKDDPIVWENNIFGGFVDQLGKSGEPDFQFRAGDRTWLAPEVPATDSTYTYDPDNSMVEDVGWDTELGTLSVYQEPGIAGLSKSLGIRCHAEEQSGIWISRHLTNYGPGKICGVALWGLSGMAKNGTAIIPQPAFKFHPGFLPEGRVEPQEIGGFGPVQRVIRWSYTNLQDPRIKMGRKYILVHQDPTVNCENVNKFGLSDVHWVAYLVETGAGARLFIKRLYFENDRQHPHPDHGSVFELFTCKDFTEIEHTGPQEDLEPGREATPLVCRWSVHKFDRMPEELDDDWVDVNVRPLVGFTREPGV